MSTLILLKNDHFGPLYIRPEAIASVRELPIGMQENRGEVEVTMVSGLRDFISMDDWKRLKAVLMPSPYAIDIDETPDIQNVVDAILKVQKAQNDPSVSIEEWKELDSDMWTKINDFCEHPPETKPNYD